MHLKKPCLGGALFLLLGIWACQSTSQVKKAEPSPPSEALSSHGPTGQETIVILGTNDLHGTVAPIQLKTRETDPNQVTDYQAGGLVALGSYIRVLRAEYGKRLVWLDAGDQFQGSVESNSQLGAPMVQFFNNMGLDAAAVGNHEFDFGIKALELRTQEAHYPYLASNVVHKESGKIAPFPNSYPRKIIQVGNLNVGLIGLSTLSTPRKTRESNVKDYSFTNLKDATAREAAQLRKDGAHLVLVTAHVGARCKPGRVSQSRRMRKISDPQGECSDDDELVELLRSLPLGTVDAVVSGHSHQVIHHWIAGVPVIQGGAFGRYFNLIYLTYDWDSHSLVRDLTKIEGPVPVCKQVFRNQGDCNGDRLPPKNGRGELVQPWFHRKRVGQDLKTAEMIRPVLTHANEIRQDLIGYAERPVEHSPAADSELGNLVADAIREAVNSDFAVMNAGGVRSSLEAGKITYGDLFRIIPFDNQISVLRLTPAEIRKILQVSQNGAWELSSISGLSLNLIDPAVTVPFTDFNGDGKFEFWEANRLLDMKLPNGSQLHPKKFYTLAMPDFLAQGGDGLGWVISQIPKDRIHLDTGILVRAALAQWIKKISPLSKALQPRLKFFKNRKIHPSS